MSEQNLVTSPASFGGEGTVSYPQGTIVMTVVIPVSLSLKTVRTIKEAVKLTLRYGALVETKLIEPGHDPADPSR